MKLADSKLTGHDYINIGHLNLCLGERQLALENYRKSITEGGINTIEFTRIMEDDKDIIERNGVDPEDLPIIIDHILFEYDV